MKVLTLKTIFSTETRRRISFVESPENVLNFNTLNFIHKLPTLIRVYQTIITLIG